MDDEEFAMPPPPTPQAEDNESIEGSETELESVASDISFVSDLETASPDPPRPTTYNTLVDIPRPRRTAITAATPLDLGPTFAVFASNFGDSLAEALADDDSVPSVFAKDQYPSLFVPPTTFQPPDGEDVDGDDSTNYKKYKTEDFKRLAQEDPRKFLRITIPYYGLTANLGKLNSSFFFKEWCKEFEARNPLYVATASERNPLKRRNQAWRQVKEMKREGPWQRVCQLLNLEFRKRYPLRSRLLGKEMQDLIHNTLKNPKQGEGPEMEAVRLHWMNTYESDFPRDLRSRKPQTEERFKSR
jgi:hypothetical protein